MLLTDSEINAAIKAGDLLIEPFTQASLEPASYDARIGDRALLGGKDAEIDVAKNRAITMQPGEFVLLVTKERFSLSDSIVGHIGVKSYFTRKGFVLLAGLQIDPGFEGHLVIGGYNAAPRRLTLDHEESFLTVEFHRLAKPVESPYLAGEEQKKGKIPRADKDYLRTLETESLSELSNNVRQLTKSVGAMQWQLKVVYAPILFLILAAVVSFGLAALLK